MPGEKRPGRPWVYVTWLTKLLANETQCKFQLWYRANFKYPKIEDPTFNLAKWNDDHTELVARYRAALERDGWTCTGEAENAFKIFGQSAGSAILSGKPDLIAFKSGRAPIVIDGKTGKQRNSDRHQVLIYLYAVPLAHAFVNGDNLEGYVLYADGRLVPVPASDLTAERIAAFSELLKIAAWPIQSPPKATPSAGDCRFCDIPKDCCPDRIDTDERLAETKHW